jgi:hypothetical protein
MIDVQRIYQSMRNAMKDGFTVGADGKKHQAFLCDKVYLQERPKAVEPKNRPNTYLVLALPSEIYNQEISSNGSYNDYTSTAQIEVYVRDKKSAENPNEVDIVTLSKKVKAVMERLAPFTDEYITIKEPELVLQVSDGSGFHVSIIQAQLRTK